MLRPLLGCPGQPFHADAIMSTNLTFLMHVTDGNNTRILPESHYGGKESRLKANQGSGVHRVYYDKDVMQAKKENVIELRKRFHVLWQWPPNRFVDETKCPMCDEKGCRSCRSNAGTVLLMREDMIHAGPPTVKTREMLFCVIGLKRTTIYLNCWNRLRWKCSDWVLLKMNLL